MLRKKLDTAGEDFNKGQSSYNKVEISTSDWKGERRTKSDSKKKDVDSELKKKLNKTLMMRRRLLKKIFRIKKKKSRESKEKSVQ